MYGLVLLTLRKQAEAPNLSMAGPYLDLLILGLILTSLKVVEGYRPCGRKYSSRSVGGFARSSLLYHSKLTLDH